MKASSIKAELTVTPNVKTFALILTMLDNLYGGQRDHIIRMVARYYGVIL